MTRYDQYGPLDTPPQLNGDRHFLGVNMRLEPHLLPPGYVSSAVNMRFRNGIAETRLGFIVPPWANKIVAGQVQPWGVIHGVGEFSDPFTHQSYLVIAADGLAYYTQPNNAPQAVALPAGVTLSGPVSFTQAFNTLIMHRGADAATLQLPRITQGFELVSQTATGSGTQVIPNATHSVFLQNRLFIPNDNDEVAVSDFADYTRYVPILQEMRVNQGSADSVVALYKYNETTLVAFKDHSLYLLNNIYGNLAAIQQDELTNQFGLVARKSIAHVGKDLWFLSELGVMSLTQTEQGKIQGVLVPVSDPIQPLMDRINWRYAANAVSAYWDNKYYLAVPLDDAELVGIELAPGELTTPSTLTIPVTAGATYRFVLGNATGLLRNGATFYYESRDFVATASTVLFNPGIPGTGGSLRRVIKGVNNAVLVYDFLNEAWCGHDEAGGFSVTEFQQLTVNGKRRLLAFGAEGYVRLLEEDYEDALSQPYTDVVVVGTPADGSTVRVNGGTTVTVAASQTATTWYAPDVAQAQFNLYSDGSYGYYTGSGLGVWTAPDTFAWFYAGFGVRFYSTNGVLPSVVTTGTWATVTEVNTQPVVASMTTRGYAAPMGGLQDFRHFGTDLQTWAPETTIEVITPGVNEELVLVAAQTKDRTLYYSPADATAFDLDNDAGNFLTPYRQDYSLLLGTVGAGAAADFALHTTAGGVPLDRHQEVRFTEPVQLRGRTAQIRITNTQGRIRILGAGFESEERQMQPGTQA